MSGPLPQSFPFLAPRGRVSVNWLEVSGWMMNLIKSCQSKRPDCQVDDEFIKSCTTLAARLRQTN